MDWILDIYIYPQQRHCDEEYDLHASNQVSLVVWASLLQSLFVYKLNYYYMCFPVQVSS